MKKTIIATLGLATLAPALTMAATTFTIKNEVKDAKIGTVSSITRDCKVNKNDGETVEVTCDANLFSNDVTFPLSKDGKNISFISASNPSLWHSQVNLRDPRNNEIVSYCNGTTKCVEVLSVDAENSYGNFLVSKTTGDDTTYVIKNINQ